MVEREEEEEPEEDGNSDEGVLKGREEGGTDPGISRAEMFPLGRKKMRRIISPRLGGCFLGWRNSRRHKWNHQTTPDYSPPTCTKRQS